MKEEIRNKVESILNEKIVSGRSVSGGCINDARIITTVSLKEYFIKINSHHPSDMFVKEANSLSEIAKPNSIRVPKVIYATNEFILLEVINSGKRIKNFWEEFGRSFAMMHKFENNCFGFYEDNYIGSTQQLNVPTEEEKNDWTEFYFNKRLKFQFYLAEKNGYSDNDFKKSFSLLENKIESILHCENNKSSLLHGDLWSGNFMVDENGKACLIDPAVYYGHHEADLAMTKLFGGFDRKFYSAYNEVFPLDSGYEYRENIYKLYHVLNHLNLFGIGYYRQAIELIKYYI